MQLVAAKAMISKQTHTLRHHHFKRPSTELDEFTNLNNDHDADDTTDEMADEMANTEENFESVNSKAKAFTNDGFKPQYRPSMQRQRHHVDPTFVNKYYEIVANCNPTFQEYYMVVYNLKGSKNKSVKKICEKIQKFRGMN